MKVINRSFLLIWEKDWAFIPSGIFLLICLYLLNSSFNILIWQQKSIAKLLSLQVGITRTFFQTTQLFDPNRTQQIKQLKLQNQMLREALLNQQTASSYQILSYPFHLISTSNAEVPKVGAMVTADGVLLGMISQSTTYAAKVELLNQINGVPILAITDSGVTGLVVGDGQKVVLTQIPNTIKIKNGEKVMTLGQLEIKSGLILGFIGESAGEPTDPTKKYIINQPLDFNKLTEVEVY